jgi:hypothetical protein
MLIFVASPRAAKAVLAISAALAIASILLAISNRDRLALIGTAWSIGLAIPSIVLIWLEANDKKRQATATLPDA